MGSTNSSASSAGQTALEPPTAHHNYLKSTSSDYAGWSAGQTPIEPLAAPSPAGKGKGLKKPRLSKIVTLHLSADVLQRIRDYDGVQQDEELLADPKETESDSDSLDEFYYDSNKKIFYDSGDESEAEVDESEAEDDDDSEVEDDVHQSIGPADVSGKGAGAFSTPSAPSDLLTNTPTSQLLASCLDVDRPWHVRYLEHNNTVVDQFLTANSQFLENYLRRNQMKLLELFLCDPRYYVENYLDSHAPFVEKYLAENPVFVETFLTSTPGYLDNFFVENPIFVHGFMLQHPLPNNYGIDPALFGLRPGVRSAPLLAPLPMPSPPPPPSANGQKRKSNTQPPPTPGTEPDATTSVEKPSLWAQRGGSFSRKLITSLPSAARRLSVLGPDPDNESDASTTRKPPKSKMRPASKNHPVVRQPSGSSPTTTRRPSGLPRHRMSQDPSRSRNGPSSSHTARQRPPLPPTDWVAGFGQSSTRQPRATSKTPITPPDSGFKFGRKDGTVASSSSPQTYDVLLSSAYDQPAGQIMAYPAPRDMLDASENQAQNSKGSWRLFEEDQAIKHMLDVRDENRLKGETRFKEVASRLQAEGIDRSMIAVKNYWNRTGRARSGFDERKNKTAPLATSKQGKKAKEENGKKRRRSTSTNLNGDRKGLPAKSNSDGSDDEDDYWVQSDSEEEEEPAAPQTQQSLFEDERFAMEEQLRWAQEPDEPRKRRKTQY